MTRSKARRELVGLLLHGPRSQRVEICRVVVLALLAELAVRALALPRAAQVFGVRLASRDADLPSKSPAGPTEAPGLAGWARRHVLVVGLVMAAAPGEGLCLRESLVLGHRLRSLEPWLVIGVRRHGGEVQAHAWLVADGVEIGAQEYSAMVDSRLPS